MLLASAAMCREALRRSGCGGWKLNLNSEMTPPWNHALTLTSPHLLVYDDKVSLLEVALQKLSEGARPVCLCRSEVMQELVPIGKSHLVLQWREISNAFPELAWRSLRSTARLVANTKRMHRSEIDRRQAPFGRPGLDNQVSL